jgi:hypothetical protein
MRLPLLKVVGVFVRFRASRNTTAFGFPFQQLPVSYDYVSYFISNLNWFRNNSIAFFFLDGLGTAFKSANLFQGFFGSKFSYFLAHYNSFVGFTF